MNITPEMAKYISEWHSAGRGVRLWDSADMCDLGWECYTPGDREDKPHWKAGQSRLVSPQELSVVTYREVKRFHVAVRMGASGVIIKLTDASSARLRRALEKTGEGSVYRFDYDTQEAVIEVPDKKVPFLEWKEEAEK